MKVYHLFDFSILIEFLCNLLYHWVTIYDQNNQNDQMSLNSDVGPGNGLVLNIQQIIPWVKCFKE